MKQSILTILFVLTATHVDAADYFLTIGGGYNRQGNQASLEANVRFLQEVLIEKYDVPPPHTIYFADGLDEGADLQVAVDKPKMTAERVIADLHSRSRGQSGTSVTYRNHQISAIAGSTKPSNIRTGLQDIAARLFAGDRLIVYVTAHGSASKTDNKFNTSIDCWDRKSFSAADFSRWLDDVPQEVPVILVMAQCYCGGFAHTIFDRADSDEGLSSHLRTGFFAQQHDLPAAGCRPDIDNDEEYSSFFWGALVGRSRNGNPIQGADLNDDGVISFAEAHAHAVLDSNTIDIPLRASEALLRQFSRVGPVKKQDEENSRGSTRPQNSDDMIGLLRDSPLTLAELVATARPDVRALVTGLVDQLNLAMDVPVADAIDAWGDQRQQFRSARRSTFRGRSRGASGRNNLRDEVFFVWPELADADKWKASELLNKKNRDGFLEDIKLLPSFAQYQSEIQQREQASDVAENAELSQIKFRRLIETLVSIALAENLAQVANADVVDRYQQMLTIEESGFAE